MTIKHRVITFLLGICLIISSTFLLTEMRPELKLIPVAFMIASVIGLFVIFRKRREGA